MAKIDTSSINGYAEMTPEQRLAALEAMELPEADLTGFVRKDLLDKAASEAASFKKQLRERQTAEEAAQTAQAEELASMQTELATLRTEKAVEQNKAKFLGLGYGEAMAQETAKALVGGEMDTVFRNHAAFLAERDKTMKAELLKTTPTPPGGQGAGAGQDYQARINAAQLAGNFSEAAYYTRLAAQAAEKTTP